MSGNNCLVPLPGQFLVGRLAYKDFDQSFNSNMLLPLCPQDGDETTPLLTSSDIVKVPDPQMCMVSQENSTGKALKSLHLVFIQEMR